MNHQLIVLGNGFDLQCGLHSRFVDFFEERLQRIDRYEFPLSSTAVEKFKAEGLTFWDLLLKERRELRSKRYVADWSDIERMISEAVEMRGLANSAVIRELPSISGILTYLEFLDRFNDGGKYHITKAFDFKDRLYREYNRNKDKFTEAINSYLLDSSSSLSLLQSVIIKDFVRWYSVHHVVDVEKYLDELQEMLPSEICERLGEFLLFRYSYDMNCDLNAIGERMLNELSILEEAFCEHLQAELNHCDFYSKNASHLLDEILDFELPSDVTKGEISKTTVLSFNYIDLEQRLSLPHGSIDFINVHGKINEKIIIGADGMNCLGAAGKLCFSKTFRVLNLGLLDNVNNLVYKTNNSEHLDTLYIKFYGHSLSSADYSYFQAIFDLVNLHSSSVELFFFYKSFSITAKESLLFNIADLLNYYAYSAGNEYRGKNLMHRLMLEGRLHLVEL